MAKKNGGIVKKSSKTDRARNPAKGFNESRQDRSKTIKVSRDEPWPPPPPKRKD